MLSNNLNFIMPLIVSGLFFAGAIALLRILLALIYATGNRNDAQLQNLMKQVGIPNWKALEMKSGLSSAAVWQLRDGELGSLKLDELNQFANSLHLPLGVLLEKLGLSLENSELQASRSECLQLQNQLQKLTVEKEKLHQEGLRLHSELEKQQVELTQECRNSTFEQLQTLLANYPSLYKMVEVKPELPAKNLLSMFTPLENLLKGWGYEPIGTPWEQVAYDPQVHQADAGDITEGELVYIRFIGYKQQDNILCPAKVSRTLPGGAS